MMGMQHRLATEVVCPRRGLKCKKLTNCGICEHDKQTGVINPLNLEPSTNGLPLGERSLYVTGLELLWEPSEG